MQHAMQAQALHIMHAIACMVRKQVSNSIEHLAWQTEPKCLRPPTATVQPYFIAAILRIIVGIT